VLYLVGIFVRFRGGKRHRRYWIVDGAIDLSSTPTLSQVRARSTSPSPTIWPRRDNSRHHMQELEVSASVPHHSLSYISSLYIIITLGWNIIYPARRREEGTYGDGGEDEGGASGSLRTSTKDGGDVLVHVEPWRHTVSCSTTSVVPYSWPCSIPYSYGYQNFSLAWYIFTWSHRCNLLFV
jgi:hypothetical protein